MERTASSFALELFAETPSTVQVQLSDLVYHTLLNLIPTLGNVTLGDILEILPFEDPIVVLELDGAAIWDALEASLETWPAQEG